MSTDPFFWIVDPDPDPLCILLCDTFPDPDHPFVTRSFTFQIPILSLLPDTDRITDHNREPDNHCIHYI